MSRWKYICITSLGSNLDSQLDFRSTQAQYFLIFDGKGELQEAILNKHLGAGESVASIVRELAGKGVGVFITGNVDGDTFSALSAVKIKIFSVPPNLTVKQAFARWYENKISPLMAPNQEGHLEGGQGKGMGRGFGGGFGERNFRLNPQNRRLR